MTKRRLMQLARRMERHHDRMIDDLWLLQDAAEGGDELAERVYEALCQNLQTCRTGIVEIAQRLVDAD